MSGYALTAFLLISSKPRGNMGRMYWNYAKNYVQEKQKTRSKELSQPGALPNIDYGIEAIFEEKEKVFREIYPCIKFFEKIIYDAKKELESEQADSDIVKTQ
jgi:hypothetical protein